ncbi:MAG: hypothetical protein C0418_00450 [Coriobacteriaceae bacterium]|nr:hypothetical protein [Coriobacteriaceae bacterium]
MACVGVVVMAGWAADVPALTAVLPDAAPMKPITALGFVLAGVALGMLVLPRPNRFTRLTAAVCASVVITIGGMVVVEYVLDREFGICTALVRLLASGAASDLGQMAPTTAVCFVLLGVALLLLAFERRPHLAQSLALTAWLVAATAALGYLYVQETLYRVGLYTPMAVHTAVAFFVLASGILTARADVGWMAFLTGDRAGSDIARRILPIIIVFPVVVGWLRLLTERAGHIDTAFGVALTATASATSMSVFVLVIASRLNAADSVRLAAEQSSARLANIVEASDDAIISVARDHTIASWNPGGERIYGYAANEVIGRPFSMLVSPELREDAASVLDRTLAEDQVQHLRRTHMAKDGRLFTADVTLSPIRDASGAIIGLSDVVRDVTREVQSQEDLRRREEALDAFFTTSLDLLCIADTGGRFLRVNPEWERVLGYPVAELEGGVFLDYVHPDDIAATLEAIGRLSDQQNVAEFVNRYRAKDGSYRYIEWRSHPVGDFIYAAARDITERKAAESALNEANKELESFSYSVSHDLRAPLRHISGFVDLLEQSSAGCLDERSQHYLTTIAESAHDMGDLIDGLLTLSRMGRAALSMERLDLDGMVREYIENVDDDTKRRGIEWVVGELPAVRADRAMMRQVLSNLLGNAVKYTGPRKRPRIEVGTYPEEGGVAVFVRDNGVGFDMAYADKLFGVFQRLHDATEFEGTGIGLANVRRVISRHGGRTWAEGAVDQGATFFFSLPNRVADPGPEDHDEVGKS